MRLAILSSIPLVALLASETVAFSPKFAQPIPHAKEPASSDCSSLYCSDDKVNQIYNNSLDLFLDLQNMLADLRDEKTSHGIDREHKKNLDVMVGAPNGYASESTHYPDMDSEDMDDFSSDLHDFYLNLHEPVPFIHLSGEVEPQSGDHGSDRIGSGEHGSFKIRPKDEEEIDRALSRLEEMERENESGNDSRSNERKYLR